MKFRGFATLLIIAIVSFATPAKADTTVAAASLDVRQRIETSCPVELGSACESVLESSDLRIAANTAYSIAPAPAIGYVVMLSQQDGIACLVEAEGSANGELSCGFVDNE
jgi:hypothetical protein